MAITVVAMRPVRGWDFLWGCWFDRRGSRAVPLLIVTREIEPLRRSSRLRENVQGAFQAIGDGSETNLNGGFGKSASSHSTQSVTALPGAENLLDPAAHLVDRPVVGSKAGECLSCVLAPHAGGDDTRDSTLGAHRSSKVISPVGAVGEHLAGIVGESLWTSLAVIDIGWRDGDLLDQRRICVRPDMRLEAVVCTENVIRVDDVTESLKLAE
jgi:hypothetical protein